MILEALGVLIRLVGAVIVAGWLVLGAAAFGDWVTELRTYRQPACRLCGHRHGPAHERAHDELERLP